MAVAQQQLGKLPGLRTQRARCRNTHCILNAERVKGSLNLDECLDEVEPPARDRISDASDFSALAPCGEYARSGQERRENQ